MSVKLKRKTDNKREKIKTENQVKQSSSSRITVDRPNQSVKNNIETERNESSEDPTQIMEEISAAREEAIKEADREIKKLKESLKLREAAANILYTIGDAQAAKKPVEMNPLESRRSKYLKRKPETLDRSEETLRKLQKFTESLKKKKLDHSDPAAEAGEGDFYHGQVLETDENTKDDLSDWFVGKLKCKKHIDEEYRKI